jgi:5-methylcytosine-specific restriction enzyme A
MSDRRKEFSRAVKRAAFTRCGGRCVCTAALSAGNVEYHHIVEWELSRDSSLDNAVALCRTCHRRITDSISLPIIAKVKRLADGHINAQSLSSRPMPCGRNTGFKKTMRGEVVARFNLGQMLRQMGRVR